ncbi:hypothetical protein IJF81_03910 [bacterium]|nr:hypothetical protein [bacterium]
MAIDPVNVNVDVKSQAVQAEKPVEEVKTDSEVKPEAVKSDELKDVDASKIQEGTPTEDQANKLDVAA